MTHQDPLIERDIHIEIPDHQVLLSFVNDEDAVKFHEWWNKKGYKQFEQFCSKRK